jgi:hypothetical protein
MFHLHVLIYHTFLTTHTTGLTQKDKDTKVKIEAKEQYCCCSSECNFYVELEVLWAKLTKLNTIEMGAIKDRKNGGMVIVYNFQYWYAAHHLLEMHIHAKCQKPMWKNKKILGWTRIYSSIINNWAWGKRSRSYRGNTGTRYIISW